MHRIVNDGALDALFRWARTPSVWLDQPVGDTLLRALAELVCLSSIGADHSLRLAFAKSAAARARLAAALPAAGENACRNAPIIALLARAHARNAAVAEAGEMQLASSSLVFAARALGLDCRPVWGFDAAAIDAAFFPDGAATQIVCALGYGSATEQSLPAVPEALQPNCQIL